MRARRIPILRGRAVAVVVARGGHALCGYGLPAPRYVWPSRMELRSLLERQLKNEQHRHSARKKRAQQSPARKERAKLGKSVSAHHKRDDTLALHLVNRLVSYVTIIY